MLAHEHVGREHRGRVVGVRTPILWAVPGEPLRNRTGEAGLSPEGAQPAGIAVVHRIVPYVGLWIDSSVGGVKECQDVGS